MYAKNTGNFQALVTEKSFLRFDFKKSISYLCISVLLKFNIFNSSDIKIEILFSGHFLKSETLFSMNVKLQI